jgi:hypothetical protein
MLANLKNQSQRLLTRPAILATLDSSLSLLAYATGVRGFICSSVHAAIKRELASGQSFGLALMLLLNAKYAVN